MNPPPYRRAHSIAVLDGKPVSKPLPIGIASVPIVDQVAQFVNQDIIEIEIPDCGRRPHESPHPAIRFFPSASMHFRLSAFSRQRGTREVLDQRLLEWIQVERTTPLHAVTWQRAFLPRHPAELNDLQTLAETPRQFRQTGTDLARRDRMPVSCARLLHNDPER
jgi:hypothetical protein